MPTRMDFLVNILRMCLLLGGSAYLWTVAAPAEFWHPLAIIVFLISLFPGINSINIYRNGLCPGCHYRFPGYRQITGFKRHQFWHRNKTLVSRWVCLNCGFELAHSEKKVRRW